MKTFVLEFSGWRVLLMLNVPNLVHKNMGELVVYIDPALENSMC